MIEDANLFCGIFKIISHLKVLHGNEYTSIALFLYYGLFYNYRQTSNNRRTTSPNLNVSRSILQLPLPNPLKPGVKSRMKMSLEEWQQAKLQLHLSDQQLICQLRCDLY